MLAYTFALVSIATLVAARPHLQNGDIVDLHALGYTPEGHVDGVHAAAAVDAVAHDTGASGAGNLVDDLLDGHVLSDLPLNEGGHEHHHPADGHDHGSWTEASGDAGATGTVWGDPSTQSGAPSDSTGVCTAGETYCCNEVTKAKNLHGAERETIHALLGLKLGSLDDVVGAGCSQPGVLGLGSNACHAQTVCCDGETFNGLVTVGCKPGSIGL
ncbi:fungal hydrophobin-domain-containing protein [Schizophyllum fasciatum]